MTPITGLTEVADHLLWSVALLVIDSLLKNK